MRRGRFQAEASAREDAHPFGLPSLCGILIETAFSNVDWRTSSVALKARLFTTRVLLACPNAVDTEAEWLRKLPSARLHCPVGRF